MNMRPGLEGSHEIWLHEKSNGGVRHLRQIEVAIWQCDLTKT